MVRPGTSPCVPPLAPGNLTLTLGVGYVRKDVSGGVALPRDDAWQVDAGPVLLPTRVAGADANPYLVMALLLASAHHGITQRLDPGEAVAGDGYAAAAKEPSSLPSNWFAAVDRLDGSAVLRDYLGDRFVDMFVSVKRTEQARFFEVVTALDYDWYLRNA